MLTVASQLLGRKRHSDEEQLLKLFWNRAELKRSFAQLRRERDQLRDKLRQQEGSTLRAQQRLEHLEGMLADPAQAANAAVFYQLRGIWSYCRKRLARLATDLAEHQQGVEHRRAVDQFDVVRAAVLCSLEERITETRTRIDTIANKLRVAQGRYQNLRGFWNYFRRRTLLVETEPLESSLEAAHAQLAGLEKAHEEKGSETEPALSGLALEGKRKINLALIAMAQELYLHFSRHNVSGMVREAAVRNLVEVNYGTVPECRQLNYQIEQLLRNLQSNEGLAARVRSRSRGLAKHAHYRRETDTVPVAGSFAVIAPIAEDPTQQGPADGAPTNVLADEFWDIYGVLLT
jgi:hypothetical protein